MGFLNVKTSALSWESSKEFQEDIKQYGIWQAINLWNKFKNLNIKADELKWGEELEYEIVTLDCKNQTSCIHVEGYQKVCEALEINNQEEFIYQPEFGSWMVEAVPLKPYRIYDVNASKDVLGSLIRRRQHVNDAMFMSGLFLTSLASFPNLGVKGSFVSEDPSLVAIENYEECNIASRSNYILDQFTNPHPRFPTMMKNIRSRRGQKVDIRVPLYPDENTGIGQIDGHITPGYIHMDSQHFGMGNCCLQVTFETQNVEHAKYLHDSFIPLGGIIAALSASAPIYKGQLSNVDLRWNVIRDSVDSRTTEEKDPNSDNYVPKSRYSGMNHFISDHPNFASEKLNDGIKLKVNQKYVDQLVEAGISERLAYHFAALFVHDPLVIYGDHTNYDEELTDHFENLNSTNWNSVRFKPPPALDSKIGWRVEFRTIDVQITDFENTAFITLMNLMTKVLNDFEIDVSLPISLSDINLERAHQVDAVTQQKFWWRKNIVDLAEDYSKSKGKAANWTGHLTKEMKETSDDEFIEMTILDILIGNEEIGNVGLMPLFEKYMDINEFSEEDTEYYCTMLDFLVKRARGEIKTGARFMRDLVLNHPEYKKDSVVSNKICFDLVKEAT